jgi:hypothetical protein
VKWFRKHVKHGSRLALLALAIQFALSFGHFHAVAAPAIGTGLTQADPEHAPIPGSADTASEAAQQQPSNHDTDRPAEACAICAVISLANSLVFPTPPLLLLPQAVELLYLTVDAEFAHLNSVRSPFQSRAPPAS